MQVKYNDELILEMSEIQKKVIANDIPSDILEDDLKRRICYICSHKHERCMARLKSEWEPKLKASGVKSIPLDDDEFAQLVFSQPSYKDRKTRDDEAEELLRSGDLDGLAK